MRYEMITAPVEEPVMAEEVKIQLQITQDEYEDQKLLIDLLIGTAREEAEALLNRALINQTWKLWTNCLEPIILPRQRVVDIVSVKYLDESGVLQTLDPALYTTRGWENRELVPAYGAAWPSARGDADSVMIEWLAGYGDDYQSVPRQVRQWMLCRIRTLYDHRDQITTGTVINETPRLDDYISFLRVTGV